MKYKILWIDDDHEELMEFKMDADIEGIQLIPFKSANKGIEYLGNNIENIDGVILDAMIYKDEKQEKGTEDLDGFVTIWEYLNELRQKKFLPRFILSGQTRFENDYTFSKSYGNHYSKSSPQDLEELFNDIKEQVKDRPNFELKYKYRQLLEVCNEKYLGEKHFKRLFSLIKHIEAKETLKNPEDLLNPIRKIIEAVFVRLGDLEIIPRAILQKNGWINGSSIFLSNRHNEFKHKQDFIPPIIAENIYRLLNIIQDGSHGEGELRLKVDEYLMSRPCDYFYKSIAFLLFDILHWFKLFVDDHQNIEENKSFWAPIIQSDFQTPIDGEIMQDAKRNYHCKEAIFAYSKIDGNYDIGTKVKIEMVIENTNPKTNTEYPYFISKFQIIS